ncbi:ATP-binding protein [Ralstonia flatus]|nr:AAA family ATPase [Ralstonia sp. LMG 32965]MBN6211227.1 ATP-binding protein [Ralstonia pickettii]
MKLKSISYVEFQGHPQEWRVDHLRLGPKNLLVGKNSSGKSRSISVIGGLARQLSGQAPPFQSGSYECLFQDGEKRYDYKMTYDSGQVTEEFLHIDGREYLARGHLGIGTIIAEGISKEQPIAFQTPPNSFAAFARRDSIQHGFLEPLAQWADSLRLYHFAGSVAKNHLAAFISGAPSVDDKDENAVVGIFRNAVRDFGDEFIESMKTDMRFMDYPIKNIDVGPPISITPGLTSLPNGLSCIRVEEEGLLGITDQLAMSDGMFRVLAILVHVNLAILRKSATTILVDDIGEGLDFDRSIKLIELLRSKASVSGLQLVMSTNDRFVMNHVPLEEWTVLHRTGSKVNVRNYFNSKEHFDQFKMTGLSNFSFFEFNADSMSTLEEPGDEDDDAYIRGRNA